MNAGLSVMTRPLGPAINYQGTRTNVVHDYSIRAQYSFNEHWMIDFDLGDRRWESFGDWKLNDAMGKSLQSRQVSFLIAEHAISESVHMNYVIPFYSQFRTHNTANLYFGVMAGMVTTTNDNAVIKSRYNAAPDSNYMYTSSYHYAPGIGFSFGVQTGFTYYVIPRLGVNVELAARYATVATSDTRYASENSKYHTLYFPETLGIRWKF